MATVRWTERAKGDLQEVYNFIARDSPRAADALVERIARAADRLAAFRKADVPCRSFQHCRIEKLLLGTIVCSIESKGNPFGLRLWFTGEGFSVPLNKFGEDAEGHAENG